MKSAKSKYLSIIVPVYNAEATLEKCLLALRGLKNFEECEIIAADDNSTDSSVVIAEKYADKVVRNRQNKGAAFTRNLGARQAVGEFLFFVDSDVVLLSVDILDHLKEDFLRGDACGIVGIYEDKLFFDNFFSAYKHWYMCYGRQASPLFSSVVSSAILALARNDFEQAGGFNENFPGVMAEDVEFSIRMALKTGKLWCLDDRIRGYHFKKYSLFSLFKTNQTRIRGIAKATQKTDYKKSYLKSCASSFMSPLFLSALSFLLFLLSFFNFYFLGGGIVLLILFFVAQFGFFKYLKQKRNSLFALSAVCFSFLEMLHAAVCAVFWQLVYKFKKE